MFPNYAHDDSNESYNHSPHNTLLRAQIEHEVRVISRYNGSRYPDEVTTYKLKS